jgi:phage terminase large subunit
MNKFVYTTAIRKMRSIKARIKIIQGSSSAGKTFGIIPILINEAINNSLITISIVSESLPHLRRGAIKDFLTIMKITNRYIDSHWNKTNSTYTFANGSVLEFFSVEDDTKLRGARRNILYVNECNNISYPAYTQLAMRTDGAIWLDFNPTHKFWIEEILDEGEAERIILTYKDNEALQQTIIDFLESKRILALTSDYWKNWCRVYLDGLVGSLEGVIFNDYKVLDRLPIEAELIAYGTDFGFSNDPSTVTGVYRYNGEIILDEVIYQKGLLTSQLAKLMKENEVIGNVFCDSADPRSIAELRTFGISAYAVKKTADSILYGINLMQSYKLNVTKRSTNLLHELDNYKWAEDKENNKLNRPIDNFNHCIDGIRYVFLMRLQHKSSIPMVSF